MIFLPIEILTKISFYLPFSDRKSFALVCKRLNKSIYFKELWKHITYVIDRTTINSINPYFLNILTSIKLFSVNIIPEELHDIIKRSSSLRELSLIICFDLFIDNDRFQRCFSENICEEVRDTLSRLTSLNLSGNRDQLTDICLNCLMGHCRSLRQIDLSQLNIINLSAHWYSPKTPHNDHESGDSDWLYLRYLPLVVVESDKLSFANIIVQLSRIRNTLSDISLCSTGVSFNEIMMIATMPHLSLSGVHLDHCKGIDSKCIQTLLKYQCSTIRDLSLLNTFSLSLSFIRTALTMLPQLRAVRIRGNCSEDKLSIPMATTRWSTLQCLHVENCSIDDDFIDIVNRQSSLTKLSLVGCNLRDVNTTCLSLECLLKLDLSRSYGFSCSTFLSSIFAMTNLTKLLLDSVQITDTECNLSSLTGLQLLSVIGCTRLSGGALNCGLRSKLRLRVLRLQGVRDIDAVFLGNVGHVAKELEELDLSCSVVSDESLIRFLSRAHKLRKLRLDNCNNISDKLIIKLPIICPYLQDVSMRNCDLIADPIVLNHYDHVFLHHLMT